MRLAGAGFGRAEPIVTGISIVIILVIMRKVLGLAAPHAIACGLVDLAALTFIFNLIISVAPAPARHSVASAAHAVAIGLVDFGLLDGLAGLIKVADSPLATGGLAPTHAVAGSLVNLLWLLGGLVHAPVGLVVVGPRFGVSVAACLASVVDASVFVI